MLDDISLPIRDINKLNTQAQIEKTWVMNNSIYQEMFKQTQNTLEANKCLIQILDTKYEKAHLRDIGKQLYTSKCPSDVGQGYNGLKQATRAWKLNPGPTKKILLQGQGFKPWIDQKDCLYYHAQNYSYHCTYNHEH